MLREALLKSGLVVAAPCEAIIDDLPAPLLQLRKRVKKAGYLTLTIEGEPQALDAFVQRWMQRYQNAAIEQPTVQRRTPGKVILSRLVDHD